MCRNGTKPLQEIFRPDSSDTGNPSIMKHSKTQSGVLESRNVLFLVPCLTLMLHRQGHRFFLFSKQTPGHPSRSISKLNSIAATGNTRKNLVEYEGGQTVEQAS